MLNGSGFSGLGMNSLCEAVGAMEILRLKLFGNLKAICVQCFFY